MVREQENVKSASDSGLYMIRRSWRSIHTTVFRRNFSHFHYSKCVPNKNFWNKNSINNDSLISFNFFFLNISCKFIVYKFV